MTHFVLQTFGIYPSLKPETWAQYLILFLCLPLPIFHLRKMSRNLISVLTGTPFVWCPSCLLRATTKAFSPGLWHFRTIACFLGCPKKPLIILPFASSPDACHALPSLGSEVISIPEPSRLSHTLVISHVLP